MTAFYNEIDPYAAQWLRNLIAAGHIAHGVVDERSICDLQPSDVAGFTQVHFFAGIGGWSLAARLAGWPDDRPLWTGSCPCQPFSVAGAGAGQADARHLWPEFHRLIAACRPAVVMGEQVAAAVGKSWLDGVYSDLESIGYATGAAVVPACAVDAPHRRDRLWFVAYPDQLSTRQEREQRSGQQRWPRSDQEACSVNVADASGERGGWRATDPSGPSGRDGAEIGSGLVGNADAPGRHEFRNGASGGSHWSGSRAERGRRTDASIRLLAHGIPNRVGKLRAFGNAIVPQVAAEIIGAYLDCSPTVLT